MKRILLAVTMLALVLPSWRQAAAADVSIDFFYDNLGDGGSWVEVADYGYCWQPTVAVSNTSWRPYADGYWAYTDVGWTWVSYEDFGWATYHYGRWTRLRDRGWFWVPDREWAPAWVSWRTGGDYVGWAPLPPRRAGDYYDNSPITARVDIDFDIGPLYYNFVDVRYIGEPVLRERIFAPDQNVRYITSTVNVTNITYSNNQVYNYGPDYNTLSRYSNRPIQRLSLQRETNVDPLTAAHSKSLMKVQGDRLVIAAPQRFQKPSKPVAPKVVKEKIAQAPVERGWEGGGDPKAQAELKEKMKKEDPKTVPPPSVQPARAETAQSPAPGPAATTPAVSANPALSPAKDKGKDKDRRRENVSPAPSAATSESAAPKPPAADKPNKRKPKDEAPPPPDAVNKSSGPPSAVPPKPENKRLHPMPPEPANPETSEKRKTEAAAEKPKREKSIESAPALKNEPAVQERAAPPPAVTAPKPPEKHGKDDGKKKNEPATAPTP
jgi:hypothetical protein